MLKYRAVSFPLLIGLAAAIFFLPYPNVAAWVFTFCAMAVIGFAAFECARMLEGNILPCSPRTAGVLAAVLVFFLMATSIAAENFNFRYYSLSVKALRIAVVVCSLLPWATTVFGGIDAAQRGFVTVSAVWATVVPFGLVALLYFPEPKYLFYVMMVTKAMDTGGYIFGMLSNKMMSNGNHKLCPSVSPNKSWEGFAGGVLLAVLTAWLLREAYPEWNFSASLGVRAWWKELVLAVLLALASIAGDLTESALKRKCCVKDSGDIIPGMGGALDVMDSFIYVGPVCLFYSMILRAFNL